MKIAPSNNVNSNIGTFRPAELEVSNQVTEIERSPTHTPQPEKVGILKKGLPTIKTFIAEAKRANTTLKEYKVSFVGK